MNHQKLKVTSKTVNQVYFKNQWSSQCTIPKHPVSCIKPRLVIHFLYGIIHVSMPFSQITLPSPSPTESKNYYI